MADFRIQAAIIWPRYIRKVCSSIAVASKLLTLGRAIDDLVLLLRVLEDAFGAEVLPAHHAVELDLLLWMLAAVHDLRLGNRTLRGGLRILGSHRQTRQNLVIHWQVVRIDLVIAFVVGALDHAVLGEFPHAVAAERVSAG